MLKNKNEMRTVSFKLPTKLNQRMNEQIVIDGYGMRGKSKWIKEAIASFLNLSNFPELVDIADNIENVASAISIRIPKSLILNIEEAIINVRKEYPQIEGVKSKVIRASICQRLLRGE